VVSPVESVHALGPSTSNNRIMSFDKGPTPNASALQRDTPSLFNFGMDDNDSYLSSVHSCLFPSTMGSNPGDAGGDESKPLIANQSVSQLLMNEIIN